MVPVWRSFVSTVSTLLNSPDLMEAARIELAGRDLLCFCAPLACHGDVLLEIANHYTLGELLSTQNRRPG